MTAPVAHKSKGTQIEATISATLTPIPGLQNVKLNPGEGETFEVIDLEGDYRAPAASGVTGEGGFTADVILDPLGAEHQFCQAAKNNQTEIVGNVILGATGVETSCKFLITKWEVSAEVGAGLMASMEAKFTEKFELNEADPA